MNKIRTQLLGTVRVKKLRVVGWHMMLQCWGTDPFLTDLFFDGEGACPTSASQGMTKNSPVHMYRMTRRWGGGHRNVPDLSWSRLVATIGFPSPPANGLAIMRRCSGQGAKWGRAVGGAKGEGQGNATWQAKYVKVEVQWPGGEVGKGSGKGEGGRAGKCDLASEI